MKGHNPEIVGIKIVEGKAVKKDFVRQTLSRDARSIRQAKSALVIQKKGRARFASEGGGPNEDTRLTRGGVLTPREVQLHST